MPLTLTSTTMEQNTVRCVIFANGDPPNPETARRHANHADLLVAADGGAHHALALDLVPHVVIGDLDSLDEGKQTRLRSAGTRFFVHPAAKDETDLELALLYAAEQDARTIIVLAALGGRLDQTLANILLLAMPALVGRDVRLIDGPQTAFVVRDEATIVGNPGDTVSLLPAALPIAGGYPAIRAGFGRQQRADHTAGPHPGPRRSPVVRSPLPVSPRHEIEID
jgi:thiamine pyrophosphokinase